MLTFKPAAGSYMVYNDGMNEYVYLVIYYYHNYSIARILDIETGKRNDIIVDFSTKTNVEYNKNLTVIG